MIQKYIEKVYQRISNEKEFAQETGTYFKEPKVINEISKEQLHIEIKTGINDCLAQ